MIFVLYQDFRGCFVQNAEKYSSLLISGQEAVKICWIFWFSIRFQCVNCTLDFLVEPAVLPNYFQAKFLCPENLLYQGFRDLFVQHFVLTNYRIGQIYSYGVQCRQFEQQCKKYVFLLHYSPCGVFILTIKANICAD